MLCSKKKLWRSSHWHITEKKTGPSGLRRFAKPSTVSRSRSTSRFLQNLAQQRRASRSTSGWASALLLAGEGKIRLFVCGVSRTISTRLFVCLFVCPFRWGVFFVFAFFFCVFFLSLSDYRSLRRATWASWTEKIFAGYSAGLSWRTTHFSTSGLLKVTLSRSSCCPLPADRRSRFRSCSASFYNICLI